MTVNGKKIARVFPRRTEATPDDELSFVDQPPMFRETMPDIDEVHISVTFTYDMKRAEELEIQWGGLGAPVKVGGPALGNQSGEFVPGLYLKNGYTITSRGCPNHCWFCSVPKRESGFRELEIKDGWNILDDNLLACSEKHFRAVIDMLKRQPHSPRFTGGLEAKILKPWQAELIKSVEPERLYCAYDTPDDLEPLIEAGRIFQDVGFTVSSHVMACYVLIGYRGDTFEKAEKRLMQTIGAGFFPFAMLYKDRDGNEDKTWRRFQREWCNPRIVGVKFKEVEVLI